MRTDLFDFTLPPELVAQLPASPRDAARLLLVGEHLAEATMRELPELLQPGDLLVLNDTRVLPARFFGRRGEVPVEVTLVQPEGSDSWWALARPGKRLRPGDRLDLAPGLHAEVQRKDEEGRVLLGFELAGEVLRGAIREHGAMPLPPYIRRERGGNVLDRQDYQTVFGHREGSIAAPTASLHFTPGLLDRLAARGVERCFVTLHVGLGTFAPVKAEDVREHRMHEESYELPEATAVAIMEARVAGRRVVAVGTTVLRVLETVAAADGTLRASTGQTRLFITPGFPFRTVDRLLTNFHLPRSTLFMLVAAFAGLERIKAAYAHAIQHRFRFFSYGDACLIDRAESAT